MDLHGVDWRGLHDPGDRALEARSVTWVDVICLIAAFLGWLTGRALRTVGVLP